MVPSEPEIDPSAVSGRTEQETPAVGRLDALGVGSDVELPAHIRSFRPCERLPPWAIDFAHFDCP